jgi:hypothetical protein
LSTHGPDHEAMLQRLLCEPAALPAELAACPTCCERWRELQATAAGLQGLAAEQRAVLAEVSAARGAVGEDLVAGLVRAGLRERGAVPKRRWPWFALAAAVVIAVWLATGSGEPSAPTRPDIVLTDHFEPTGRGIEELHFRWPDDRRAGAGESFVLYLLDDPDDPLQPPRRVPCETNQWIPDDTTAAAMRQRDHWMWRVERVGPPVAGQRARVALSALQEFWFSR